MLTLFVPTCVRDLEICQKQLSKLFKSLLFQHKILIDFSTFQSAVLPTHGKLIYRRTIDRLTMAKLVSFGCNCFSNCCCCSHCYCADLADICWCSDIQHVDDQNDDENDVIHIDQTSSCSQEYCCRTNPNENCCPSDQLTPNHHSHKFPYHLYCKPISYVDCSSRSAIPFSRGQQSATGHQTACGLSTTAIPVSSLWSQVSSNMNNTNNSNHHSHHHPHLHYAELCTSAKSAKTSPESSSPLELSPSNHSSISSDSSNKKMCQTQLPILRFKSTELQLHPNSRITTNLLLSTLVTLSLLAGTSLSLPESHDAWRHPSSMSAPSSMSHLLPSSPLSPSSLPSSLSSAFVHSNVIHKKSKSSHANFASSSTLSLNRHSSLPSSSSNYAAKQHRPGSAASHLSRTSFNPYRNNQLLSIPFSSQLPQLMAYQQHHQFQQQQHNHHHQMQQLLSPPAPVPLSMSHSIVPAQLSSLPLSSTSVSLSGNQLPHSSINSDNGSNNNHIHLESNKFPPQNTGVSNSIRIKGSKWWDIANHPASISASLEQTVQMSDSRHSNSIMPTATTSLANNINLPLRKKQRRLVRDNPGVLTAISKAMRLAIHECQNQFKERRWNCPVNDWKKGKNLFGKITQRGCRETAFVYALTSAAVAHSIARACSEGQIETCTCDYRHNRKPSGQVDWEWGGCSDNIEFGHKFAKSFVDAAERGRDLRFVMNLHNNEAGRLHVSHEMRRECKCHGMSGSCTVKTCWMRLPSFRDIGNNLKDRFDGASRVLVSNDYRGITRKMYKKVQLKPYETGYKSPTRKDLIYFEESPDYCVPNPKYSVSGTQGRVCNASSIGVEGCGLLCCGRGYVTEEIEEFERCNCTFHWCCEVRCRICKNKKKIHRCL